MNVLYHCDIPYTLYINAQDINYDLGIPDDCVCVNKYFNI